MAKTLAERLRADAVTVLQPPDTFILTPRTRRTSLHLPAPEAYASKEQAAEGVVKFTRASLDDLWSFQEPFTPYLISFPFTTRPPAPTATLGASLHDTRGLHWSLTWSIDDDQSGIIVIALRFLWT